MVYISPRRLLGLAFPIFPLLARATTSSPEASPSPAADTELICPTDNAAECYPRLFQPTKDFQDIKEGQDIPSGLHVRLNVYTGQKEARLNIPMKGEEAGLDLEGIPTEQAVVVVEQPEEESVPEPQAEPQALRDQVPQKPPPYEPAGKIVPPPPNNGGDMGTFQMALLNVGMESRSFDMALDDLSELSHDIYYGVEITKNGPVLEKLICLILGSGSEKFPAKEKKRDHKAATILASSIQNNPTALKEVASMGKLVMYPTCSSELMETPTKQRGNFVSTLKGKLGREKEPSTLKAKVTAISGLLKEPTIRKEFLKTGGMEMLLAIWLKKGEQWDTVRMKVAQLVMDNFLDESMGAALGVWPKKPVAETKTCEIKSKMLSDGCWEHHIEAFSKASPDKSWAVDFLQSLKEQRKKGDSIKDREL
jgi:nucleotide exchange factor SIL1